MTPTHNFILAQLSDEERGALLGRARLRPLAFGQTVFTPGDDIEAVWFPETGVISIIIEAEDGSQAEAGLVGPENAAGILEALGTGVIATRGLVQATGSAWAVPTADVRNLFDRSSAFRFATQLSGEFQAQEARQSLFCRAYHPVGPRLARWLLEMMERRGEDGDVLEMSQEVLGALLAVQRTTVSTHMARLQTEGVISVARGRITVKDRAGLEDAACGCRAALAEQRRRIHQGRPLAPAPRRASGT